MDTSWQERKTVQPLSGDRSGARRASDAYAQQLEEQHCESPLRDVEELLGRVDSTRAVSSHRVLPIAATGIGDETAQQRACDQTPAIAGSRARPSLPTPLTPFFGRRSELAAFMGLELRPS